MIVQKAEAPVSMEAHYEILRSVEMAVMAQLRSQNSTMMPVGTRVGYFTVDGDGNATGQQWKLECGYVETLDQAPIEYVDEQEWQAICAQQGASEPLPIEFVDQLYETVKSGLQGNANQDLAVEVSGVVMGSPTKNWGSACTCPNRKKRYYLSTTTYCTSTSC